MAEYTSSDSDDGSTSEWEKEPVVEYREARKPFQARAEIVPDDLAILSKKGYCIGEEISAGTFATVRYAEYRNRRDVKKLAVKIIDKSQASHLFVQKFLPRELLIWPQLNHSSIIRLHKIFSIMDRIYFFMDLAINGTVIQYLQCNGATGEGLARRWFGSLVGALKYCHSKGVAHRDVKCDNLLLDENFDVKLGDFGFARLCLDSRTGRRQLSDTYCGSSAYVAPEVIQGVPYDPLKADIWSSGICLYVILNNAMPFDDANVHKLYKDQMQGNWRFASKVENCLSDQVKTLIIRLLQPDITNRVTLDQVLTSSWMRK